MEMNIIAMQIIGIFTIYQLRLTNNAAISQCFRIQRIFFNYYSRSFLFLQIGHILILAGTYFYMVLYNK